MYDAFISYRRQEPDRSVAVHLHGRLETFRTPAALVRRGVGRRLGSIFLDDQELEAGSLSAAIRGALSQSRFLFVVCSPETPRSSWIAEEIAGFCRDHTLNQVRFLLWDRDVPACLPIGALPAPAPPGPVQPPLPETTVQPTAPAPSIVYLEPPASRRRGLSARAEIELFALLLGCTEEELARAVARRSRLRRAVLAAAAVALLGTAVAAVVGFNLKDTWHTVRQPQLGFAAGPVVKAQFLFGHRVLSRDTAGLPQVLHFQGTVPRSERTFSGQAGSFSDFPGAFSPRLRRQLVAERTATGAWTARVLDLESGAVLATPASVDDGGRVLADFAGNDDLVYFLPDRMEPDTVALYSLSRQREIALVPGIVARQPWLKAPAGFVPDPWQEIVRPGLGLLASPRFLVGPRQVDGRQVAALWDLQRPAEPLHLLTATESWQMISYAVDARGERAAVLEVDPGKSSVVSVWSLPTGERLARHELHWGGGEVAFTADGRYVLVGGPRFEILRSDGLAVELESGDARWVLAYPWYVVPSFDPLRRLGIAPLLVLASRSGDTRLTMLDAPVLPPRPHHLPMFELLPGGAESAALSPNEARDLLFSVRRGKGDLWDLKQARHVWSISVPGANHFQLSVDERAVAAVSPEGAVRMREAATGRRLTELTLAPNVPFFLLAYDPGCERAWLATGLERIWISHGQELFGRFTPRVLCGPFPP